MHVVKAVRDWFRPKAFERHYDFAGYVSGCGYDKSLLVWHQVLDAPKWRGCRVGKIAIKDWSA